MNRDDLIYCRHCGEVNQIENDKCKNCNQSQKTITIMQQERPLAEGIRLFDPHANAPDFVLASLIITLDDLYSFAQKNPQMLADYQGKKQLKLQILRSKEGKMYSAVDTYGTPAHQQPQPQQEPQGGWGAPQQQATAQGWGQQQQQQQQPQQGGWGAPTPPQQQPAQSPFGPGQPQQQPAPTFTDKLPF